MRGQFGDAMMLSRDIGLRHPHAMPKLLPRDVTPNPPRSGRLSSKLLENMVPAVWIEQTTYRLQGGCSTAELSRHIYRDSRAAPSLQRPGRLPFRGMEQ